MTQTLTPMFSIGTVIAVEESGLWRVVKYKKQYGNWFLLLRNIKEDTSRLVPINTLERLVNTYVPRVEVVVDSSVGTEEPQTREDKRKAYKKKRALELKRARQHKRG